MTVSACAALVHKGDSDRFMSAMTARPDARAGLFVLYAFNLEIAKAPWVTEEPMIAEMRLQWWRDVIEEAANGKAARAHEVAGPLSDLILRGRVDADVLDHAVAARRWDIYKDPFEDEDHLDGYLADTAGGLMWAASRTLAVDPAREDDIRTIGATMGLANWLRAVPAYVARGRIPLLDGRTEGLQALAARGLAQLDGIKRRFGPASPAVYAGWQTRAILKQVVAQPSCVADGTLGTSEFHKRGSLLWQSLSRR